MEAHVSYELATKLNDAGIKIKSEWYYDFMRKPSNGNLIIGMIAASAPMIHDLLRLIPKYITGDYGHEYQLKILGWHDDTYSLCYEYEDDSGPITMYDIEHEYFVEACGELVLRLKTGGYLEQVDDSVMLERMETVALRLSKRDILLIKQGIARFTEGIATGLFKIPCPCCARYHTENAISETNAVKYIGGNCRKCEFNFSGEDTHDCKDFKKDGYAPERFLKIFERAMTIKSQITKNKSKF